MMDVFERNCILSCEDLGFKGSLREVLVKLYQIDTNMNPDLEVELNTKLQ